MKELRPTVLGQLVLDFRQHGRPVPRDALHDPLGFAASPGRVEQKQLADPPLVVAGDDGDDLGRMVRNGTREEHGVRPVGIRSGVFHLGAAIGIHGHEQAVPDVRRVGVIPAQVEDAAVVEHAGRVIVVLLEGELPDVLPVRTHLVHHADDDTGIARNALERRGGKKNDLVVRQVNRVIIVDVPR